MDSFRVLILIAANAFVGYEIISGRSVGVYRYSEESAHAILQWIYRTEFPTLYWISVGLKVVAVLFLWFRYWPIVAVE